jgi:hypothetical protein
MKSQLEADRTFFLEVIDRNPGQAPHFGKLRDIRRGFAARLR